MTLHQTSGYISGSKGTYGDFLDLSAHEVPRDVFDLIPVKAKQSEVEGRPFWRKDWTVRRNGTTMELSFFCDQPPANQVNE